MVYKVPPPWCLSPAAVITQIRSWILKNQLSPGRAGVGGLPHFHKPLWAPFSLLTNKCRLGPGLALPVHPSLWHPLQTQFSLQATLGILS